MNANISDDRALALKTASDALKWLVGLNSTDEIGWTIKVEELLSGLKIKNVLALAGLVNELDAVNPLKKANAKLALEKEAAELAMDLECCTGDDLQRAMERSSVVAHLLKKSR